MKTAIVYDRINKWGGAERVLLALNEIFPQAPLYTSVYNPQTAPWATIFPKVYYSFLQNVPGGSSKHELLGALMPIAFERFNFDDYDLVISVTSEAAKGIITKPKTCHICYCLTPTRYLWSHYNDYFRNITFRAIAKPIISYLKYWDKIAAQRPDIIIAISKVVQKRIKKYYGRNSEIIYPPVDIDRFKFQDSKHRNVSNLKLKNYFLIVSRLVPYKRVDLAVEVFNILGYPLIIVGTGSEESNLKSKAKNNINFLGMVEDDELIALYKNAKALIYPQEEDFGITAVESQAMGCPVIAFKKGGALDTIINNKTGLFFNNQNRDDLINAIKLFDQIEFNKKDMINNARDFSKDKFKDRMIDIVERNL